MSLLFLWGGGWRFEYSCVKCCCTEILCTEEHQIDVIQGIIDVALMNFCCFVRMGLRKVYRPDLRVVIERMTGLSFFQFRQHIQKRT